MERGSRELPQAEPFSAELVDAAQEYRWPGNLRELRNFVTRTLILQDQKSACEDLRNKTTCAEATPSKKSYVDGAHTELASGGMKNVLYEIKSQTEIQLLHDALKASGWNRRRAASNLNISDRSLLYKIQQHGLSA